MSNRDGRMAVVLTAAGILAGCSGAGEPRATEGPLPDGIYRGEVTPEDVEAAGLNNAQGWTGTWTLEVDDGTYTVSCRPLDQPGQDCGQAPPDATEPLEAGRLEPEGELLRFAFDVELLAEATGCVPASGQATGDGEPCYTLDDYVVTWSLEGDRVTFDVVDGPGHHLTSDSWRKIG